ncbi:MAG: insulinase family protein [Candidatus Melainabacteria bacterium]|jgi:zinc protease|nr:insulinase family protein [Candidatus Melainabacteria bacterium]
MSVKAEVLTSLGIKFVRESGGISEYLLESNGLKILLSENHNSPVVTVMPLYRVGSRNEAVGHTGATHILEHMMFKGVKDGVTGEVYNFPDRFRQYGGVWNATTWFDRTNYFETVPARHLELCLATEADRMRNLLIKEEERVTEMTVVRSELEIGENNPDRVLLQKLYAHAFVEHPYHHPTIGWTSDVEAISVERLKAFYDVYYWPNNTTLLLIGDFESEKALALVAKYYGVHPSSPQPIPPVVTVEPKQEGERRFEIVREGDSPRVALGFHVPEAAHADTYSVAAIAAILGSGSKSSRLYRALVDTKLATQAYTWHFEQRDPGMIMVFAAPADGVSHETVEKAILAELEKLASEGVDESELKRAKLANRKRTVLAAADPMKLADAIGEAESVADFTFYTTYGEKLDAVTAEDVKRAAAQYFTKENRTVGYFIPKRSQATADATASGDVAADGAPLAVAPAGEASQSSFAARTQSKVLANGLKLQVLPTPGTGIIGMNLQFGAGGYFAPAEKPLVASFTSSLLTSGTASMDARQISAAFEEMGAGIGFRSGNFYTNAGTKVAAVDFENLMRMAADMLINPTFPEKELATLKLRYASHFKEAVSDPESISDNELNHALYGVDSVFHDKSPKDCLAELATITRDDLVAFHKSAYTPKGAVLSVVGDITVEEAVALVEATLGAWEGGEQREIVVPMPAVNNAGKRIDVHVADKRSASISLGYASELIRTAEDFAAARIANAAFGGGFTSRLFKVVRVKNGLTYGVYSAFSDPTFAGGKFGIDLQVNPKNIERAVELVTQLVRDFVASGITEQELTNEVGYAIGTFEVQLRNADAVAATMTQFEVVGLGVAGMDAYADEMSSLTKEKVDAAIRKYIDPDKFVTVVAGTLK